MTAEILKAVALAFGYVDGLRTTSGWGSEAEAQAFLEYLAGQGFVVRPRDGAERIRLKPQPLEQRRISGAEIRTLRTTLGLSLTQLARRARIYQETLARIESGRTSPQARTLTAIMDAIASARAEHSADMRR